MERPNHLNVAEKSASSRATSIAIVVGIHVAAILGLVAALNQGALMKQLQEIKATVDTKKEIPKAPPPPPPDMVKPPPPAAIIPDFQVATAAPPPVTVQKAAPPAPPPPPARPTVQNDPLRSIARTHTQPPYPPISVRLGEQGTSLVEAHITTEGNVDDCKVIKGSGSDRLDGAACDWIKSHWRWQPPTFNGAPTAVSTQISVTWNLKDAR